MKTILILSSAVAYAAAFVFPVSAEICASLSFVASLALVFTTDYGRRSKPLLSQPVPGRSRESLRLAA